MPLESCMILLDCSEYMRNGDYIPTRLGAQIDAANLLVGAKTNAHQESTVGVAAGTELLVSPCNDVGKILNSYHNLGLRSDWSDITAAVQVASLALKHRPNKDGAQRIILFVGTPLNVETRVLQKAGRQLKKNNVAIDVVALGELEHNEEKLRELVDAANGRNEEERTCHLVAIPAGVLPSDVLASSPLLAGNGAYAAAAVAVASGFDGNPFSDFGGVDPNMDPELAMALRVSMEEERARQERAAAPAASSSTETQDAEMMDTAGLPADMGLSEEEALLQRALAMSMNENEPVEITQNEDSKPSPTETGAATQDVDMEEEDEDAAMQMALQMSMQPEATPNDAAKPEGQFQDTAFVNELLGSMPGVDPNDPEIQEALRKAQEKKDDDKET